MDQRPYRRYSGKQQKNFLLWLAALILLASLIAYLFSPFHVRKFAAFPALLGVFLGLFGGAEYLPPRWNRLVRQGLCILAAVLVAGFALLEVVVLANDRTDLRDEPDVVVVLGAQIHPWGPSVLLADRLDTAFDYLKDNPQVPVIVSGGQGPDEVTTEAVSMRDYLVSKGLDPERIWLEEESHNTKENLLYSRELMESKGLDPDTAHVLVVSNGFHLARVRMLAARQALDVSTLAAPASHLVSKMQSYIREGPAIIKSFLFDW